ncbi:MAG: secretin and TonB N-terminal domain-containing protein, partial [Proteiniphilum sp.]|nr:secretin and TonB N-terminal domain-containing protein [Proteiniphilum sp.]
MRTTLFLLFFCILFSQAADSYSQETSFTLDLKSTSIKEICEELEKKSDFRFIFAGNVKTILKKKVNLTVDSKNIEEILNSILSNTNLVYKILEDQVVIYQDDEEDTSKEIEKILSELTIQQQSTVKGKVVDQQGEPLPGVTITIDGTPRGVITDIDGTF